jgi:hypothetical protein
MHPHEQFAARGRDRRIQYQVQWTHGTSRPLVRLFSRRIHDSTEERQTCVVLSSRRIRPDTLRRTTRYQQSIPPDHPFNSGHRLQLRR